MIKRALLVVDVQNDFCPGGSLAVNDGDQVIEPINRLTEFYNREGCPIFYSRDWHPLVTRHFKKYNGSWPEHCVLNTHGAEFHPNLIIRRSAVINKGESPDDNDYSPFKGRIWVTSENGFRFWISFPHALSALDVEGVDICGLATDWCDKAAVLDSRKLRYKTRLILDACRSVNLNIPDDPWRSEPRIHEIVLALQSREIEVTDENIALEEMRRAGVVFTTTEKVISETR